MVVPMDQPYKACVQIEQADVLDSSTTTSLTKIFSTVWLSPSHSVFAASAVNVLPPFSIHSGGVPLRTLSSHDNVTLVAHACGDDLYAENFEVLWQFKLFAQGICSAAISETAKAQILTLNGTEVAPRRNIGRYTGEEHYLGWKEEHFRMFFHEYIRSSIMQAVDCVEYYTAESWKSLQIPIWASAADLGGLSGLPNSGLDQSLQERISANRRDSVPANKMITHRDDIARQVPNRKLPRCINTHSRVISSRRDQASKKGIRKLSSIKSQGPASRASNIYTKLPWYRGKKGPDRRKDRSSKKQNPLAFSPINTIPTQSLSMSKPITSLRDVKGLGPAVSKTRKPFHSITACFQHPKSSNEKVPLTQPVRDFIAHKIEERLLDPAQKEAILHIVRTVSPREFDQRRNGRLIDYHNMSDHLYRQLALFVSDLSKHIDSPAPATNLDGLSSTLDDPLVPKLAAQALTPEMVRFTRENFLKLSPDRLQELGYITERTVPSVDAMPVSRRRVLQPEELPVENQIMIWRYVKMHLPRGQSQGEECGVVGQQDMKDYGLGGMASGQAETSEGDAVEADGGGDGVCGRGGDDTGIDMDLDVDYGLWD